MTTRELYRALGVDGNDWFWTFGTVATMDFDMTDAILGEAVN